jgi:hypothetical protein
MAEFDSVNHPGVNRSLQEEGYAVVKRGIPNHCIRDLRREIELGIDSCVKQLGYIKEDYLRCVSRWVDPSPVTAGIASSILKYLSQTAQALVKKPVYQKKMNVICKNAYCTGSIAYHQDITYSPQDPYEFSMWVALDDISPDGGPLEVIPGSHLLPLKPAIDFWSPNYQPNSSLKMQAQKLILNAGDIVFFDSRLWHGSGDNRDLSSRYALVVRWSSEGWKLDQPIPPLEPDFFGLWTSGKMTEDILREGLSTLFNRSEADLTKLIDTWVQLIQEQPLPFIHDKGRVIACLKDLKILHLAHTHHNGGDAPGGIYKSLWETFLSPLDAYVSEREKKVSLRCLH